MSSDRDVMVLSMARTPFGRFGGALKPLSAIQLGAFAMAEAARRSEIDMSEIQSVYAGIGMIGANVLTATRQALLLASGLRETVPSMGVDRACCSGMTAIGMGMRELQSGEADVVLCGGFESLSNTPFLWPRQRGIRPGNVDVSDPLLLRADFLDKAIARYTGEEAVRAGVDRSQQDEWAMQSHARYFAAEGDGYFDTERFAVSVGEDDVATDESPRSDIQMEKLARLKPVYSSPTVTPGNAPGLSDGAAFCVLTTRRYVESHFLKPLASLRSYVQVAASATSGSYTPALGIRKLLVKTGDSLASIDRIEINEAFAATPLVSTLVLADHDVTEARVLRQKTNMAGGAVAIGHPLGASGARLVMTLINGLTRRGGGKGVAAICGGYGQGDAILLEVA
ncbi:MAG: thiolase family protein [Rhizobiaceae bacterium]|nr:thiolase family protein [Rhizobiaceae bacterium]